MYFTNLKAINYQLSTINYFAIYKNVLHELYLIKIILTKSRPLLWSRTVLNAYQIKLCEDLNFMYKFKNKQKSNIFNDTINQRYWLNGTIKKPVHQYPTQFSIRNFSVRKFSLRSTKYSISVRGPKICN